MSDPSGLARYQLEVQRYEDANGNGKWLQGDLRDVAPDGNVISFVMPKPGRRHFISFRWRVREIDGASNTGVWSDWFYFRYMD